MSNSDTTIPLEFFAERGEAGIFMAVPCNCGLKQADTLLIKGKDVVAMRNQTIIPIDLPEISSMIRAKLGEMSGQQKRLPVAEFTASGLTDSYYLKVAIAH